MNTTCKMNLFNENLHYLKFFIKTKPFIIMECDKNIGSAIISTYLMDTLEKSI